MVLRKRTFMALQPLTSQLCPVAISCLFGPTNARDGTLDLRMTDVPDLGRVAGVAPIGNSNHSSGGSHFDGSGCSKLAC